MNAQNTIENRFAAIPTDRRNRLQELAKRAAETYRRHREETADDRRIIEAIYSEIKNPLEFAFYVQSIKD